MSNVPLLLLLLSLLFPKTARVHSIRFFRRQTYLSMNNYDDIIDLPHWNPRGHQRMTMEARASQFGAFAPLKVKDEEDFLDKLSVPIAERSIE